MPRFIADAMLGSLARKLRALGFDTLYYREGDDSGIMGVAEGDERIILTSDVELVARAKRRGLIAFEVRGSNDGRRLESIRLQAEKNGVSLEVGTPLCSLCSGRLEKVPRSGLRAEVPQSVLSSHRVFYRCQSCGQVYWKGSHWKKLRSLGRRLGTNRVGDVK